MAFTVSLIPAHYFMLLGPELESANTIISARPRHVLETMVDGAGSIDHMFPPTVRARCGMILIIQKDSFVSVRPSGAVTSTSGMVH